MLQSAQQTEKHASISPTNWQACFNKPDKLKKLIQIIMGQSSVISIFCILQNTNSQALLERHSLVTLSLIINKKKKEKKKEKRLKTFLQGFTGNFMWIYVGNWAVCLSTDFHNNDNWLQRHYRKLPFSHHKNQIINKPPKDNPLYFNEENIVWKWSIVR